MGGLIVFEMVRRWFSDLSSTRRIFDGQCELSGVAVVGSPFHVPWAARWLSFVQLYSNCQVAYLARRRELARLLFEGLSSCRRLQIPTLYIAALEDEIAKSHAMYRSFDRFETVAGPHMWMREVASVDHPGLKILRSFIEESAPPSYARAAG